MNRQADGVLSGGGLQPRSAVFPVVAFEHYRFRIDAIDQADAVNARGLVGKLEFLAGDGRTLDVKADGSVRTDRHGAVVYLPTHAGDDKAAWSENRITAPAEAVQVRVTVRNWKCSASVSIVGGLEMRHETIPELFSDSFPVHGGAPYRLDIALRDSVKVDRAALLIVRYLDAAGAVIAGPYAGCLTSELFGHYRYLNANTQSVSSRILLATPKGAATLVVNVRRWRSQGTALELAEAPVFVLDVPDTMVSGEWDMLPVAGWSSHYPLTEAGAGLSHLSLVCGTNLTSRGAFPRMAAEFVDVAGNPIPVTLNGLEGAQRQALTLSAPDHEGRCHAFLWRPEGAVALRVGIVETGSRYVMLRNDLALRGVAGHAVPDSLCTPCAPGEHLEMKCSASPRWTAVVALDAVTSVQASGRPPSLQVSFHDAAGKPLSLKGTLTKAEGAVTIYTDAGVSATLSDLPTGSQELMGARALLRLLPPAGTATMAVKAACPESRIMMASLHVRGFDVLQEDRMSLEAINDILPLEDQSVETARWFAHELHRRYTHEPRAQVHLLDAFRRLGELDAIETVAHQALATSGAATAKLRLKARVALGQLQELDVHWLPAVGMVPSVRAVPGGEGPLRVAHLFKTTVPAENTGGAIRCLNIVNFQREAGMQPLVITPLGYPARGGSGAPWEKELIDDVPYFRLNCVGSDELRVVPSPVQLDFTAMLTARLLAQEGVDLIQASSGYRGYEQALVGLSVSRALGVPFVYEVRSYHEHTWRPLSDWVLDAPHTLRRIEQENRCMREADAVVTICETMKAGLVERGIPPEKVFVVPNSVDLEHFATPAQESVDALRENLGLGQGPVVGYISNVSKREGHHVLLRAVAQALAQGVAIQCLVVGKGRELVQLRRLAQELGIESSVFFTGEVPHEQISAYYSLIDIFVVPRITDFASDFVTPMKPFEAMAMRRPLVVSDRPALIEIVGENEERGLIFPAGDHVALAQRLVELVGEPARAEAIVKAAREWIETSRSWVGTIRTYENVYAFARQKAAARRQDVGARG
nr:glycosyltransferase family 4 protein [uncultured Pseudoxanthomonas sp.]